MGAPVEQEVGLLQVTVQYEVLVHLVRVRVRVRDRVRMRVRVRVRVRVRNKFSCTAASAESNCIARHLTWS